VSQVQMPRYNALIRRGIDDRDLYRRALAQVREPGLQALLTENLHTLDALINDLQAQVHANGRTPARHGTLAGAVRSALAEVIVWHAMSVRCSIASSSRWLTPRMNRRGC
jgi:uncharacterized protein (TIGR02284 family)